MGLVGKVLYCGDYFCLLVTDILYVVGEYCVILYVVYGLLKVLLAGFLVLGYVYAG